MSKSEDRALEAYPPKMRYVGIDSVKYDRKIDVNKTMRDRYIKAYHQAEKDLELTWQDLATIEKLGDDFIKHNQTPMSDEEFYKEILERYKNLKK